MTSARECTYSVRVASSDHAAAVAALDAAGLNVADHPQPTNDPNLPADRVLVTVTELVDGSGESQRAVLDGADAALEAAGIAFEVYSNSISTSGGSVNHRWVPVLVDGVDVLGLKVMFGPGSDVEGQLDSVSRLHDIERARLSVAVPSDLPPNS